MKIVGFLIILTFACFTSFGQINKGTLLLGGTVSYNKKDASKEDLIHSPNNQVDFKTFAFGPRGAIFVTTNLAVGLLINYEHNKYLHLDTHQGSISEGQSQTLEAGSFVRYYHFARPELAFFGQASATYNHEYNSSDNYGLTVNLAPGLTYFISSKVGLEMIIGGLSYNHDVYKPYEDNKSTNSLIDVYVMNGSQPGVSFYLSR